MWCIFHRLLGNLDFISNDFQDAQLSDLDTQTNQSGSGADLFSIFVTDGTYTRSW